MIELFSVTKTFKDKEAVKNLSLTLQNGEVFGLLGPNGAGKTTCIKMITGILSPTTGDIKIQSHSILSDSLEAKKHFSYVPDSPDMFLGMKGKDYLLFVASVYHIPEAQFHERIKSLSEEFEMEEALQDLIINYSHGMRQKIFIIASLLIEPDNWILDEPMTGLDPSSAHKVKEHMKRLTGLGKTVLFSTHVLDVAEKICDRIGIIDQGVLRFSGTVDELREKENLHQGDLEDLFLNLTK